MTSQEPHEPLPPTQALLEQTPVFNLESYERVLHDNGVRTGRHASEMGIAPPDDHIKQATVGIRRLIAPAFAFEADSPYEEATGLEAMKTRYWQRAAHVGAEQGAVAGFELNDYFGTSESRSYFSLRQELMGRNPEGSLGRELIDTVDLYHKALNINPAHAATITCELISKGRAEISALAAGHSEVPAEEATTLAFREFMMTMVPAHITAILQEYSSGPAVAQAMTKQSFYPQFATNEAAPLAMKSEDVRAMIDIFDLQNRPYSRAELRMATDIAQLPAMQMAMLGIHERLITMSNTYFAHHPERLTGDMTSWSEIFVPEHREDGTIALLPNPKLLRAISNNVLPAVASQLLERGADVDDVNADDITEGVTTASRTYKLLQSKVGLFRTNPTTGKTELGNVTLVTCPANQVFPNFLMQYLGPDYEQLANLDRAS